MLAESEREFHGDDTPIVYNSLGKLRQNLIYWVELYHKQFGNVTTISDDVPTLYNYHLDYSMVYHMLQMSKNVDVDRLLATYERESLQIIIHGILAAWITIDDSPIFTQTIGRQAGLLSTGLILKHPIAIKRAAAYVAGISREDEIEEIMPKHCVKYAHNYAIEQVIVRKPELSRRQILTMIPKRTFLR